MKKHNVELHPKLTPLVTALVTGDQIVKIEGKNSTSIPFTVLWEAANDEMFERRRVSNAQ
ncbi:MAG TPA: hypothetical protein VMW07_05600 [Gallionella sp.]|nr:hypothetical protein [Gallionella sp.]